MAGERDDSLQSISVRLDGKNYSYWSYVMKNFLKGKKMWGYVSGISGKPDDKKAENYVDLLDVWEANNSKIITWVNNSVEHSIGTQLAKYETAKEVWDHLARLYTQSNFAKQYQLESDIRALEQKSMSIQEFYSAMTDLWDQLALTESAELRACAPYIARREEQRLVQFLMALRDDFEGLRGSILHRSPLPSVDSVVSELLAEEIRLKSQAGKGILPAPNPSVLAVSSRPSSNFENKLYSKVGIDECSFCKQKGHWKAQCPKLLNKAQQSQPQQQYQQKYQKQSPSWKLGNQSQQRPYKPQQFNTAAIVPPTNSFGLGVSSCSNPTIASLTEQFQKFLATQPHAMSASSSIGQLPPSSSGMSSSIWVLDSGASHHMSPDSSSFVSLCPATSVSVMTADGSPMPLAGVGSIVTHNISLSNVYHIPNLTLNLVSVSQLCDSGYSVSFSSIYCHVQDPQSQKLIGTGHRQGGLYILDELKLPVFAAPGVDMSSFRLSPSSTSFYLWHSRLGHVSASRLKFLASTGALGNLQNSLSSPVPCTTNTDSPSSSSPSVPISPFPLHYSRRSQTIPSADTGTSLPDPPATQAPSEIVDPHPRYPRRTQLYLEGHECTDQKVVQQFQSHH
ncbi:hypothetical protein LWI29_035151 [Acer saccharum]|uniref:GAG-pre-integrase domain-containing protein n=1 Tax=Acer saccharum TaxID=4024 RepID=A0AA39SV14_ACESA|nr:hypothetical protein LWI29_035151 [Acer saccharum]